MMTKIREGYKETEIGVIPEDWDLTTIKEICRISTGKKNTQDRVEDGIYPFFVRSDKVERINSYSFDGEAVLTAGDGVGVGKVFHYVNEKFDIHQRVYKLSDFNETYSGKFFYWYFSNNFYDRVKRMSAKTSVDSVRMDMISEMIVPFPSLTEQQRIAEILSTADSHIEKLDKIIEDYQLLKKGMMKKLLTEGIGHTEFKETEIGRIPKAWEIRELNRICKINPESLSAKEDSDKKIKYIDIESVSTGKIGSLKEMKFSDSPSRARRIVKKEDIIVSTVRPYLKAFAAVETGDDDLICSTGFAVLRINQSIYNYKFLFQTTISDYFINQLLTKMVGSNYPAVNSGDLANTLVTVPPLQEQQQIAEILSTIDNNIDKLQNHREDFVQLKKSLMEKLLTGKVRVI